MRNSTLAIAISMALSVPAIASTVSAQEANNGNGYFQLQVTENNEQIQTDAVNAEIVNFPDKNMEAAVKSALGIAEADPVTSSDMLMLDQLNAVGKHIESLVGMQFAKNLVSLDVTDNDISDISVISTLPLTSLKIGANHLSDIHQVGAISTLSTLDLSNNGIDSLDAITGLQNLSNLTVSHNPIDDLSPLGKMGKLKQLDVASTKISTLEFMPATLVGLNISNNKIADWSGMANLPALQKLDVSGCRLDDLEKIVHGPRYLAKLTADDNYISNTRPLAYLHDNTSVSLKNQHVVMADTVQGKWLTIALRTPEDHVPAIVWATPGSYDEATNQLEWEGPGQNSLTWSYESSNKKVVADGTVTQLVSKP
ncbi:leucine-rich repeat domain-containing protein [Aeromonas hydrophila]